MRHKKNIPHDRTEKGKSAGNAGRKVAAYGDGVSICTNAKCVMRKKAKCSGYEGCPGFKGK